MGVTLAVTTCRMRVSYLGTAFAGWQRQRSGDTIQGHLETALQAVVGQPVSVIGAGRTDAGVHAYGQVAHVVLPSATRTEHLATALNSLIPREIRVEALTRARDDFHARHDAASKVYRYRLSLARKASPFVAPLLGRLTGAPPDVEMMRRAAHDLTGSHDFSCFCGSGSAVRAHHRRILRFDLAPRREEILFEVEGDGFLRHQVRNMVGTLIEVGQGRRAPDSMPALLRSKNRRLAGPTAPASGLCLVRVRYGRRLHREGPAGVTS